MPKPDYAHLQTEKELAKLEKRIAKLYKEARDELEKTVIDYFTSFEKRDVEMKKLIGTIQNGKEWTEADYKQWRLNQIGRGNRFEALRDLVAERYTNANEVAVSYVNDETPGIYSLNRNYSAYTIDKATGGALTMPKGKMDASWTLFDESTVRRLMVEKPGLMPNYPAAKALKRGIDLAYGKKQITSSITSAILQGKSIKGIADDLQTRIPDMNRASAIRTARTSITGAQNGGRQDTYQSAVKMGIKMKKQWLATLDSRTRHSHAMLDGEIIEVGKKYSNGCRYPGDPHGKPHEVYNCRCTEIAVLDDIDTSDAQRRARDPKTGESVLVSDMSYQEWAGWKKAEPKKPVFTPAATIEEAEKYADRFVQTYKSSLTGKVDYKGIDLQYANDMNRAFTEVLDQYDVPYKLRNIVPFNTREKRFKDTTAEAAYQWGLNDMFFNKKYYKNPKAFAAHEKEYKSLLDQVLPNIDFAISRYKDKPGTAAKIQVRYLEALKNTGRTNVNPPSAFASTVHELGHYLDDQVFRKAIKDAGVDLDSSFEKYSGKISGYATSNKQEYIAESFSAFWNGETDILDPAIVKIFEGSKKK